jgi:trehalose 6-phosphate synthase
LKPGTVARIEALKRKFNGINVIVGVERLDYIKGLPQKFLAFESFLEQYPEYRGKVTGQVCIK